jgi:GH25 family lysozyme M1 (1,4-beta-N-acetylmuramidase)
MQPLVIDIYHGDVVKSFTQVKAAGILGVIHKATQGGGIVDHAFSTRRKQILDAGLKFGAYHFFDFTASASHQADFFLSVAEPDADTLIALDWENVGNKEPSADLARAFLEEIETKLNRKAVIYSGNVAKEQIRGNDAYFGAHKLWLCQYGATWKVQESWSAPWLWQNNGDGSGPGPHTIPGIAGLTDNNTIVAPMTAERLMAEWVS